MVPGPKCRPWGLQIRSWAHKSGPGYEKRNHACRKTMQNAALGIPNGAIWCKLWPKTIFEPNSYKVRLCFGGLFGIPDLQNWCLVAPPKASQKESAKRCGKGSTFDSLDMLKLHEGSQKSWFQGLERKLPEGPAVAAVWEAVWCPKSPKSHKNILHVGGPLLASFLGGCHGSLQAPPV